MPQFRYDGFGHVFKKNEDDPGIKRGEVGTFSQEMVDRYTEQGHAFTKVESKSESVDVDVPATPVPTDTEVAPADARVADASVSGMNARSTARKP